MACRAPKIDAQTGEYALQSGGLVEDTTVASEVILALRSRRGSGAAAPWFGSRFHTIRKLTKATPALARAYGREAVQHIVDRGDMRDLEVFAEIVGGKRLAVTVGYTDRLGQRRSIPYTHAVSA